MIEKPADTAVPIHPLLARRWSPRAFRSEAPPTEALKSLFEAARWAPSSSNIQPWRFIMGIRGAGGTWEKIFSILDSGNQEWCRHVPVLALAVAARHTKSGRMNRHYGHDVGQALAHLTVQAMSHDIFVHQMAGFSQEKAAETFGIPTDDYEPFTAAALGYMGDPEQLDEKNAEREHAERTRKQLSEVVFESWEQPYRF